MKRLRDYFSWSQYYLWHSSKKEFYKRYGLGEESKSNIYFNKGKELADYKETGHIPGYVRDPHLLELVSDAVPDLDVNEHKIEVKIGDYDLLAYVDSGKLDFTEFNEYKTGKIPWTQQKVDEHEQLDFYALCYYIKSCQKTIPNCTLYWIETEEIELENGNIEIRYTGNIEKFHREFSKQDIINMMAKIIQTINEIDEWEYVDLTLDENRVNRYIKLLDEIKEKTEEANLIKLEIQTKMDEQNVKYASAEKGSFTLVERDNWSYSEKLTNLKNKYKNEIKAKEKKEQKTGEAKLSTTKYIKFSKK